MCIFVLSPSVDGVGLVEYFCTHLIYICAFSSEEDPDFVVEDVEWRLRPRPTLLVVLVLCKMLLLAHYSEPELETVWIVLWCITVAVLLLIECLPPRRFVR